MAKYVFLNMPGRGHVNPTLAVVHELVKRGQEVSYYLTEEFRSVIEATGAVFQAYETEMGEGMPPSPPSFSSTGGPMMSNPAMLKMLSVVPPHVVERVRAEQPDVIVYDSMCMWAIKVVEELHIPAIAMFASYAANEHFNMIKLMRERMKNGAGALEMAARIAKMGPAGTQLRDEMTRLFSHFEAFNIVFIPKEFQPKAETFDSHYLFVGPSILPRQDAPDFPIEQLNSELPLLYISLGTVFTNQTEFYKQCFVAFGDQPWQVVLSIGKNTDPSTFGPIPNNFLLSGYVPQLELLPRTRLFVTHSGANSMMESLYFGVPMVLIPQQPEQRMNAERAVELGVGVLLEKENLSAQMLREAVERVDHDVLYRERAQQMQQSVRVDGGYQRAVDGILQFTKEHTKVKQA